MHATHQVESTVDAIGVEEKLDTLGGIVRNLESVVVAFSGGVDSTLLLYIAHRELGDRCAAASGLSATYAPEEMEEARDLAAELGVTYHVLDTMELTDPRYADNTHQRCFFCKQELYGTLTEFARQHDYRHVVDGSNADDLDDFRPGMRAARDLGVRSPLQEAGLSKAEIRALSAQFGLRTADKPAVACLSSRFQYGDPITVEKLLRVQRAESGVRALGFRGFRVRHHDALARLEFSVDDLESAFAERVAIVEAVLEAGYRHVTIDLEGYRTGSMNAGVPGGLIQIQRVGVVEPA